MNWPETGIIGYERRNGFSPVLAFLYGAIGCETR